MSTYKVAVDDQLTSVRQMIQERGYSVVNLDNAGEASAVVVANGTDGHFPNAQSDATIIDAAGKDPYIVYSLLREKELQKKISI